MKCAIVLEITLLWLLWLQSPVKCRPIPCPLSKNIARYAPNGEIVECVPCANCPIGQGLSFPCGSKVSNDSKIECVFCEPNKTYSDDHGRGHCKTCQDCGSRNVIQECTIIQNRECGNTCPKGSHFDTNFDDCVEVESETPKTTSTHSTKTVKLETNHKETTETQSKTEAYHVTTSTGVDNTPSQGTSLKGNDDSKNVLSIKEDQPGQDPKTLSILIWVLVAVVVLTLLILVIVTACKKRKKSTGNAAEIIPLNDIGESEGSSEATTSSSSTQDNNISRNKASSRANDAQGEDDLNVENIPADILVSGMEMLRDENGTLFKYVQTQLDAGETCTRKTWRSVGRELKVHSDILNLIPPDGSPTEHLLGYLKTLAKEPTMREFVQALKNCGRNDIAKYICNGPWASTKH